MKKVLLIVRNAPYGSVFAAEAMRTGIAFAGMDLETKLIFVEDGVFCLCKKQNPKMFSMTSMKGGFKNAKEFGLKIFAHENSLLQRSIQKKDILPVQIITNNEMRKFIEESDTIINF